LSLRHSSTFELLRALRQRRKNSINAVSLTMRMVDLHQPQALLIAAAAALKVAPFMACSGFFLWDRLGGVGLPSLDSSSLILQSGQQSRCFSHPIHS
jgi:hypothetical protein